MKKLFFASLCVLAMVGCNNESQIDEMEINTSGEDITDDFSYAIGVSLAEDLKEIDGIDYDRIAQGMKEATAGKAAMDMQQAQMSIQKMQMDMQQKMIVENLAKSEEFLAANAKKEGVITTESGLQYKVIKEGTGASPSGEDKATVHYDGTLIDGTPFDSSRKSGKPFEFSVAGGVIKGWLEGAQLMKEGGIYEFYIHPDLGYGANPRPGGAIQPNDALVFEIELLKVN